MSQQVYEPKLFAHGTVPGSRTYVNSEHEQSTVVVIRPKSVILTYVLWLFLGWLGIHKFYLRQPIQGLLYLALTGNQPADAHRFRLDNRYSARPSALQRPLHEYTSSRHPQPSGLFGSLLLKPEFLAFKTLASGCSRYTHAVWRAHPSLCWILPCILV